VLSKRLVAKLPGVVRFHGRQVKPRRWKIEAYYRGVAPAPAPLELTIGGVEITVDVVAHALPPIDLEVTELAQFAFTGVYPGGSIAIDHAAGREYGAICALLARPGATQPSHLVTCGHMFPPGAQGLDVVGGDGSERVIGTLVTNLLDRSQRSRDVALVRLTPDGVGLALAGGPGPKLVDYASASSIFNLNVRTFRPTMGDYSTTTKTSSAVMNAYVTADLWPQGFNVEGVIATSAVVSQPGDSGTVLATNKPVAIGSCTADDGGQSIFEPLGRAIDDELKPKFQLTLWRNS
jgi:hypothetical protein